MKYLLTGQESNRLRFRLLTRDDYDTWIELFENNSPGGFLGMADLSSPQEQCDKWFTLCEDKYTKF